MCKFMQTFDIHKNTHTRALPFDDIDEPQAHHYTHAHTLAHSIQFSCKQPREFFPLRWFFISLKVLKLVWSRYKYFVHSQLEILKTNMYCDGVEINQIDWKTFKIVNFRIVLHGTHLINKFVQNAQSEYLIKVFTFSVYAYSFAFTYL